ncbi:cysteine hydrolase family protein [Anaerococcus octavius]|uniref:cysteine hydrolase family protein n=1 Tax=Anaerococcus octavius TaxID=54007 RepID=UPI0027BAE523|nr:isochorismatase family cysteine hydrolase [Anaerococcus octavius]MDU5230554.1 isochorismatase family cysteine hydrolase [Anaerococcus sp.]
MEVLVVVDLQNDFIDGALGNIGNEEIVNPIEDYIEKFDGEVIFTRDTHHGDYLETLEGKNLPITHCIKGTQGWEIRIDTKGYKIFDKESFGSYELAEYLKELNDEEKVEKVNFVGICTDICVISNAILVKSALVDTPIEVISSMCKGTNESNHKIALNAMKSMQINII